MTSPVRLAASAALAVLLAAAAVRADGARVIVGGALARDHDAVYRAILERRDGGGPICVLPTASEVPKRSMRGYVDDFERVGGPGAAVGVLLRPGDVATAARPSFGRRLSRCGGFFFTGGDQSRIVDTLRPGGRSTAADRAIRERHAAGAVIAGSSAGAAMMSDPMIGGGDGLDAWVHGVTDDEAAPGVWLRDGMGYEPDALTDQHHLARGRFPRLLVAVADPRTPAVGWGMDEDTALIVEPDGTRRVLGRSQVVIVRLDPPDDGDVRTGTLTLVSDGDVAPPGGVWAPGPDKSGEDGAATTPPGDLTATPWADDAFHRAVLALCARDVGPWSAPAGRGRFSLSRGEGFRAWGANDGAAFPPPGRGCGPFDLTWSPGPETP